MTFSNVSKHRAVPNGMDPPEHTRYRQAINLLCAGANDRVRARNSSTRRQAGGVHACENHVRFCVRLLRTVLLPVALRLPWVAGRHVDPYSEWTHGNQEAALSRDREAGTVLARELADIVLEQVDARREAGGSTVRDVTTSLMEIEVDGRALSDEELVSISKLDSRAWNRRCGARDTDVQPRERSGTSSEIAL